MPGSVRRGKGIAQGGTSGRSAAKNDERRLDEGRRKPRNEAQTPRRPPAITKETVRANKNPGASAPRPADRRRPPGCGPRSRGGRPSAGGHGTAGVLFREVRREGPRRGPPV